MRGGLALLWPRFLRVEVMSFSTHHIEAVISDDNMDVWRFVGFYVHHEVINWKNTWNLMRIVNSLSNVPTFFMGDFNEVLSGDEHVSQRRKRPTWQMDNFRQVLPLRDLKRADVPLGDCSASGRFTVKSAYQLAIKMKRTHENTTSTSSAGQMCSSIYGNLKFNPKCDFFCIRICGFREIGNFKGNLSESFRGLLGFGETFLATDEGCSNSTKGSSSSNGITMSFQLLH
ncbi:hypothetical protein LIER_40343 [Lithospermum erythrorhizon]|uniref:Endonuclease/exonuclease/phosphatase n=1 Tax=Lithospermum erythrorhizon TaxID=34254 RepID=A0AAV3QTA9_LITER